MDRYEKVSDVADSTWNPSDGYLMGHIYALKGVMIGNGAHGRVYCGKIKQTGELVALKKVSVSDPTCGVSLAAIREIAVMRELNSPCFVRLLDGGSMKCCHSVCILPTSILCCSHDSCSLSSALLSAVFPHKQRQLMLVMEHMETDLEAVVKDVGSLPELKHGDIKAYLKVQLPLSVAQFEYRMCLSTRSIPQSIHIA